MQSKECSYPDPCSGAAGTSAITNIAHNLQRTQPILHTILLRCRHTSINVDYYRQGIDEPIPYCDYLSRVCCAGQAHRAFAPLRAQYLRISARWPNRILQDSHIAACPRDRSGNNSDIRRRRNSRIMPWMSESEVPASPGSTNSTNLLGAVSGIERRAATIRLPCLA